MSMTATDFTASASDAELETLAANLRARNFDVVVVQTGAEAKAEVLKRIPDGAQIHSGKSKTLEDIGLFDTLMGSDEYDFVRRQTLKMDRKTQAREMVKLGATPDLMINSVQAITEAGQLVVVSASGSQIGAISTGAEKLILVVGSQKIVPNLDAAFQRIQEHVFPYEDARLLEMLGIHTAWTRTLILERDFTPGRTTVILVRDPVGV
ncbi:MAG TPA: LUD domain-containing protein [Candidatus Dormibacteraeota bacterium]|nr:LUD domain-containing protein [Candidatus Dormibacteraeota bacterium]